MTHYDPIRKHSVTAIVNSLKQSGQDFEWYPTTQEMSDCIKADLHDYACVREGSEIRESILDCGAGDGALLHSLTEGKKYAIEKSMSLINAMTSDVFIVGTDFHQQTLLDKKVDCVVSNPPFSMFVEWAIKIIKEANAPVVYLILPKRWEKNESIKAAIEYRKANDEVIGTFDFLDAERKARAYVDVIRIDLTASKKEYRFHHCQQRVDPFDAWFEENFKVKTAEKQPNEWEKKDAKRSSLKDTIEAKKALIADKGLVNTLELLYQRDLEHLMTQYQTICGLDCGLLGELGVSVHGLKEALKLRISSLKSIFWTELFSNLDAVTDRLTSDSRTRMLDTLTAHTHLDFSAANAHALVIWVIKNANQYFDSQLISCFEKMTEKANVVNYKSNKKTFGDEEWRYCRKPNDFDRYTLEYRVVLARVGGLSVDSYSSNRDNGGLSSSAAQLIDDIRTIATNIGFDTTGTDGAKAHWWTSNAKINFEYTDRKTGETRILMEVKAFKNGNLHIKFAPAFMIRLNVEFGRLKGWVKHAKQAADEMGISEEDAQSSFATNLQFLQSDLPLMLTHGVIH
jgi:hypothetical protein